MVVVLDLVVVVLDLVVVVELLVVVVELLVVDGLVVVVVLRNRSRSIKWSELRSGEPTYVIKH